MPELAYTFPGCSLFILRVQFFSYLYFTLADLSTTFITKLPPVQARTGRGHGRGAAADG
ncbi:hypothetical protein KSC_110650 [Ktedonobacter sp. SOSP1-52]|nr:hypothetical protein KSC_110650 [Ktedonobacter sp. SOSP1-52]